MFRSHPNSHIINKPGSIISNIAIETSHYKKSNVLIYFTQDAGPDAVKALKNQLRETGGNDACWHSMYCVINGSKSREIIDLLFQNQFISAGDRADIEEDIRKTETNIDYQQKIVPTCEKSSKEIIEEMVLPYLDHIVSLSNDHRVILKFLQYPFSRNFSYFCVQDITNLLEACGKSEKECEEALECIQHLKRICWGEANLESTFVRVGQKIPGRIEQRIIVANICLKILNENFKSLSVVDRFYCAAEIFIMISLNQRGPVDAHCTKTFLDDVFKEKANWYHMSSAFEFFSGLNNFIYRTLAMANLLTKEERQELIDQMQSKVLLDAICSYFPSHRPERVAQEALNAKAIVSDSNQISQKDNAKEKDENINSTGVDNRSRVTNYQNNYFLFSVKDIHNIKDLQCEDNDSLRIRICYQSND